LPKELKMIAKEKAQQFCNSNTESNPVLSRLVTDAINFADMDDTWEANKKIFQQHTNSLDAFRGESFIKAFPELTKLLDTTE